MMNYPGLKMSMEHDDGERVKKGVELEMILKLGSCMSLMGVTNA
jgi:hypothetical protein